MVKRTGPTNIVLRKLCTQLKKLGREKRFFLKIREEIFRPRRLKKGVNLWKINKYSKDNDIIIVPTKVLSVGEVTKKIEIYALSYSQRAKEKLEAVGIKPKSISDLINEFKINKEKFKGIIKIIK